MTYLNRTDRIVIRNSLPRKKFFLSTWPSFVKTPNVINTSKSFDRELEVC